MSMSDNGTMRVVINLFGLYFNVTSVTTRLSVLNNNYRYLRTKGDS